jgi:hypothetical protein
MSNTIFLGALEPSHSEETHSPLRVAERNAPAYFEGMVYDSGGYLNSRLRGTSSIEIRQPIAPDHILGAMRNAAVAAADEIESTDRVIFQANLVETIPAFQSRFGSFAYEYPCTIALLSTQSVEYTPMGIQLGTLSSVISHSIDDLGIAAKLIIPFIGQIQDSFSTVQARFKAPPGYRIAPIYDTNANILNVITAISSQFGQPQDMFWEAFNPYLLRSRMYIQVLEDRKRDKHEFFLALLFPALLYQDTSDL